VTAAFTATIGPATVALNSDGRWGRQLKRHLDAFSLPAPGSQPAASFGLTEVSRTADPHGSRLRSPSGEVSLRYLGGNPPQIFARTVLTPKATLRFIKRYPDTAFWRRSRWLLFLRYAFELPLLASLEYQFGYVPLHAATVFGPAGAVVILGSNGAGKSTLAYRTSRALQVGLTSDNFSPCDGDTVVGFPGAPKPKPGADPLPLRPSQGIVDVRGIVTVGFGLGNTHAERTAGLHQYLLTEQEGHRGTCWDQVFGGDPLQSARNNAVVTKRLSDMPTYSYDWQNNDSRGVEKFIGGLCFE
jgi:hypothetical protein